MGPLATAAALQRFEQFLQTAKEVGAEPLLAAKIPKTDRRGHYTSPTVHRVDKCDDRSTYLQEAAITATVPHTWGTLDVLSFTIILEKA